MSRKGSATKVRKDLRDVVGGVKERALDSAHEMTDAAAGYYEKGKDLASEYYEKGKDWMADRYQRGRHKVEELEESVEGFVHDRPMQALLLAMAFGMGMALLLYPRRRS